MIKMNWNGVADETSLDICHPTKLVSKVCRCRLLLTRQDKLPLPGEQSVVVCVKSRQRLPPLQDADLRPLDAGYQAAFCPVECSRSPVNNNPNNLTLQLPNIQKIKLQRGLSDSRKLHQSFPRGWRSVLVCKRTEGCNDIYY